jgi:hypothetical protein
MSAPSKKSSMKKTEITGDSQCHSIYMFIELAVEAEK